MGQTRFFGRTLARSQALQLLFQADLLKNEISSVLAGDYNLSEGPLDIYAKNLVLGIEEHKDKIDSIIKEFIDTSWTLNRLMPIDRALLRIALYEMFYVSDVAPAVAIDEAVVLAKAFGTDDSYSFVNGLLGRVVRNNKELQEKTVPVEELI